jgi:hypothetical protein
MKHRELFQAIGHIDDDLIIDAGSDEFTDIVTGSFLDTGSDAALDFGAAKRTRKFIRRKLIPAAAGFILIALVLTIVFRISNHTDLILSGNISVRYIDKAPTFNNSYSLAERLTEEELFHKYNTDVFLGTVKEIKNIEISFGGSKEYRAIAKIKINKVYQGDKKNGEVTAILLPCPINTGVIVEDTEVISEIKVGVKGIFMPVKYDKESVEEVNGERLYLTELAEYGLMDGVRFAFLETENGLIFDRVSYESVKEAVTIQEIEDYVLKMLRK